MNPMRSCRVLIPLLFTAGLAAGVHAGDPVVTVTMNYPVGGETLTSATEITIDWTATVDGPMGNGIGQRDVVISYDNGSTWEPLAFQLFFGDTVNHFVKNKPTTQAIIKVIAMDYFGNSGEAETAPFTIVSAPGGLVPTTDRDFESGGTQPIGIIRPNGDLVSLPALNSAEDCRFCHGQYDVLAPPYDNWRGSMMSHASIDPLFKAALDVNDQVAPGSGDTCLRCHVPAAWLAGRSNPTDGSAVQHGDMNGVSCDLCHRLVDPVYDSLESPVEDPAILADVAMLPDAFGQGMYVVDPDNTRRRGPFIIPPQVQFHGVIVSPFHRESALCGTCHDVSNPAIDLNANSTGTPNTFDLAAASNDASDIMSEQRTYSEWFFSAFNSPAGVYAPEFGGNKDFVSSCQDCHMRDITGRGCFSTEAEIRPDMPLHDFNGANTWILSIIDQVDPTVAEPIEQDPPGSGIFVERGIEWIERGIERARYMLQNAAEMEVTQPIPAQLSVKVTNKTGHKLPTGYPEGRRMWLNVRFLDGLDQLISESGAYDLATGVLTHDAAVKIYEGEVVVDENLAPIVGMPAGTKFFLTLSNKWTKDNRIPPLGFTNAAYESFGGAPIGATYADGQNWDITLYDVPVGAESVEVNLYYQTTSKEYVEFLRDEGTPGGAGQMMYDLWANNDRSPPELMETATIKLIPDLIGDMNCDGLVSVSDIGGFVLALTNPAEYLLQFPNCDISHGDVNQDTFVTVADIGPFVALLTGG